MAFTRREFLRRGVLCGSAAVLMPNAFLRGVYAAPAGSTKNLLLFELGGGNDGLNTLVPYGIDGGAYYSTFRPTLHVPQGAVLPLGGGLGLNPGLATLKTHYDAGRLAVLPGVGYPDASFSHEVSSDVWAQGDPALAHGSGWLGRTLAQFPQPAFPQAVEVAGAVSRVLTGSGGFVPAFTSISKMKYPTDPEHGSDKAARRAAYEAIANGLKAGDDLPGQMAKTVDGLLDLIDTFAVLPAYANVAGYPEGTMPNRLKMIARLLNANLGMRVFHVVYDGFDTHSDQESGGYHTQRLQYVSDSLAAFYADLENLGIANDTLIVIYSEFGRTVYENGSNGTDHGTVNPVFVLGGAVTGGVIGAHPALDPDALDEHGELALARDFRDVLGTVVDRWYGADASVVFPGHAYQAQGFLV